jgi:hypothetical protein
MQEAFRGGTTLASQTQPQPPALWRAEQDLMTRCQGIADLQGNSAGIGPFGAGRY